jgi:hypothetical protein
MLAHSLAETGDERALDLLDGVRPLSPAEAEGIAAILHWRRGRMPRAAAGVSRALERMKVDPWFSAAVGNRLFGASLEIAAKDRSAAEEFFDRMNQPLAVYRMETVRKPAAYLLARRLDDRRVVEALAAYEPNTPWVGNLLEARERAYRQTEHPLAPLAKRELELFRRGR